MPSTSTGQRSSVPPGHAGAGRRASTSKRSAVPATASAMSLPASVPMEMPWPEKPWAKKTFGGSRPDVRQAAAADGERAAPGVVDRDGGELRKYPQHVRPDERGDVRRKAAAVVLAAAEEQATVGGEPEVIHDEAGVVHADVVADQGRGRAPRRAARSR